MPTLNIKNPRVYELARELAEATGGSMTGVIEIALQQMLDRIQRERTAGVRARLAEIEEIVSRTAPMLRDLPADPTEFLYDPETGLPR